MKKTLFVLIIFSIILLSACSKNDSTTNAPLPTPNPKTITTSFQGGIETITNTRKNGGVHGWTEYFDLTQFSKFEISWQTESQTFPPQNNSFFITTLNGNGSGQSNSINFLLDTLSKTLDTYSVTIQGFQITGKESYRFHIFVGSSTTYTDTTKNNVFVLSNLKILGYPS